MSDWNYPEAIVGVFAINRKGELLMVTTHKWPKMYAIPGGHIELGESVADTARREMKEELNMRISFDRVINVQEAIFPKGFYRKAHFLFVDVLCRALTEKVKIDNREIQSYRWIKPKAALKLRMNKYTRTALRQLVDGNQKRWYHAEAK
ncbi:MAG: NUDIX domain-containing protein [Candidatus Micrarchaeota archaeon]|nr:NUDIX domain-containing protein [Candidatus Micrarchaeota archaeon]